MLVTPIECIKDRWSITLYIRMFYITLLAQYDGSYNNLPQGKLLNFTKYPCPHVLPCVPDPGRATWHVPCAPCVLDVSNTDRPTSRYVGAS